MPTGMIRLTPKQIEYIEKADHRWNVKSGAVRSGKSFVDTAAVIPERILERKGMPGLSVILGVSRGTVERNILEPMRKIYGANRVGQIVTSKNTAMLFGEEVYCLGAEKVSQVAKIQGASFKYVYGDEVAKWNVGVFEMLKSRLDKEYSCFDGSCNPEYPTHWFKKFLDSDADIYLQKYTIFDNPYLPKRVVQELCKEYSGTIYEERLLWGRWKRAEGAIYRKFADSPDSFLQASDRRSLSRIIVGVDFGGTGSGHSFVATGFYPDGRMQGLMSRRHMNADYSNGIDANLLADLFLRFITDLVAAYGMPQAVFWDNAETVLGNSIRNACAKQFPRIAVIPAAKKRIKDRIDYAVRLMGAGLFSLTKDCGTLSTALQEAVWNEKAKDEERLDDGSSDIDTLDAFEYTFEREINGGSGVQYFDF